MPTSPKPLTQRAVDALTPGPRDTFVWDGGDGAVKGFGVKVTPAGRKVYVYQYDDATRQTRRITIGPHGPYTPATARAEATKLYLAARGAKLGLAADPHIPRAPRRTLADLWAVYRAALVKRGRKATTLRQFDQMWKGDVAPSFGTRAVAAVTRDDVRALVETKAHAPAAANNLLTFVSALLGFGVAEGWVEKNVAAGIERFPLAGRERVVTPEEYVGLGRGLTHVLGDPGTNQVRRDRLAGFRFTALTGWRVGEVFALRWADLDETIRTARLPDTKTGASVRPLGAAAWEALPPRTGEYVFGPPLSEATMGRGVDSGGFRRAWNAVRKAGGAPSLLLHDLRHGFITTARELGYPDHVTAALVGHSRPGTTTGYYGGVPEAMVREAADRVSATIAERLNFQPPCSPSLAASS